MITDYYGGSTDRTILRLFTEFSDGRPQVIHREAMDADAYDSWHLAFYSRNCLSPGTFSDYRSVYRCEYPSEGEEPPCLPDAAFAQSGSSASHRTGK